MNSLIFRFAISFRFSSDFPKSWCVERTHFELEVSVCTFSQKKNSNSHEIVGGSNNIFHYSLTIHVMLMPSNYSLAHKKWPKCDSLSLHLLLHHIELSEGNLISAQMIDKGKPLNRFNFVMKFN